MHSFVLFGLLLLAALIGWGMVFLTHYRSGREQRIADVFSHATAESAAVFFCVYVANELFAMIYGLFGPPPYFEVFGVLLLVAPYGYCLFLKNKWRLEGRGKS